MHRADPEVKEWVQVLTQRYAGMKIVVGRDKLDEVQVLLFPFEDVRDFESCLRASSIKCSLLNTF